MMEEHVKDICLHYRSRVPLQPYDTPKILLQILQPVSHQITQFPPANIQLRTLLDEFVDPPLMLVGDNLSGHLAPSWLLDFGLHSLQFSRFSSENIPHFVKIAREHFLLILHVLPDVSFALLEGIVEDLQDAFTQTLEFAGYGAVHLVVESVQLVVQIADFALNFLVEVLQHCEGFDAGCLKTSEVRSGPIGEIALGLL